MNLDPVCFSDRSYNPDYNLNYNLEIDAMIQARY